LSGVGVNIIIYYLFICIININYIFAAFLSFLFAVSSNFFLNKFYTFKNKETEFQIILVQYGRFITVSLGGLLINIICLILFVQVGNINKLIAQLLAIMIATLNNFFGSKEWAFKLR
jgi:dolichol-phosphate mannosyltransferase